MRRIGITMTSQFIRHHPCTECGSKDNLAEYTNSWYCFGCGYYKKKNDLNSLRERLSKSLTSDRVGYPLDTTEKIPPQALKWLLKYNITPEEIANYNIGWHEPDLLVLYNTNSYWQGRVFSDVTTQKYKSWGQKPIVMYGTVMKAVGVVLVEDILSAICVARVPDIIAIPMFGTSCSRELEKHLQKLDIFTYVWLDGDVKKKSIALKNRLKSLGLLTKSILTSKDPKTFTKEEIEELL
jgi:ribosomal protein S27AE